MTTAVSKRSSYVDPTVIPAVHQRELMQRVTLDAKDADNQFDLSEDGAMRKFFPAIEGYTPNGLFERFMGPQINAILIKDELAPHAPASTNAFAGQHVHPSCEIN